MGEPSRFFDAETGGELQLQLQRDGARFQVLRPFAYRDPRYDEPFIIPADPTSFRTDMASIPWLFAWLVPGLGTHLPAVLVHDGLVAGRGEGKTHLGPDVDREEADRILRDAMADLGTPLIRRWLIWTGAILATSFSTLRPRWYWPSLVVLTLLTVGVLGTLATFDLVDAWDVLPWMGQRPWTSELVGGAAFAAAIPLAISPLWGRLWKAGAIAGIGLAFLLHVTVAVLTVYGLYWVAEKLVSAPRAAAPTSGGTWSRRRRSDCPPSSGPVAVSSGDDRDGRSAPAGPPGSRARSRRGPRGSGSAAEPNARQLPSLTCRAGFRGGPDRVVAPTSMHWRQSGATVAHVPSIQVKDVPDDVHATLRGRAAAAGKSLQEYLLARLVEEARSPTLDELLDRASGRAGGRAGFRAAAGAVRTDRDAR